MPAVVLTRVPVTELSITASGHVLNLFGQDTAVRCPLCQSAHTHLVSQFGSTACKALYQCDDCREPFDYFKCHS